MYDKAQIISENNLKKSNKTLRETSGYVTYDCWVIQRNYWVFDCLLFRTEEAGIELQILGGASSSNPMSRTSRENNNSNEISQANSAVSIDYPEQVASTIGMHLSNKKDILAINKTENIFFKHL